MNMAIEHPKVAVRDPVVVAIVSAYFEVVTESASDYEARELSVSIAMLVDVDRLFVLGRAVRDPQPWVPFLRHLRSIPAELATLRYREAESRMYMAAVSMLERQGLSLIRPEDVLARPSPFAEALVSLSPSTT